MGFQKAVHLHPCAIAKQPAYLRLAQPPLLIAFQSNLFEDMAWDVRYCPSKP
jgi:hypothetical protein